METNSFAQPWRVMQEIDTLLMKTIPWSQRVEQIGHSLLRLLDGNAIWLLTAPQISGIAVGIVRTPLPRDPQACVVFADLAPPPIFTDPESTVAQVLRDGVPRFVNEVALFNGHLDNDLADALLQMLEVRPSLIVPLLAGGEPVGAMVVADGDYPPETWPMPILQAIGEHLGVTLQSAYLRDASQRQAEALATLNRIAHTLNSSLDIEEVTQRTMAGINEILDVEAGSLLLLDENAGELYFKVTLRGEDKRVTAFRLQKGQGIAGWVVAHNASAIVHDVRVDPRFYSEIDEAIGFKTRSVLCVPLVVQGRPIGALEVINKQKGHFTADDQELLTSLSSSLAIALQNAGLFEAAQHRTQRSAILRDSAIAINISPSLREAGEAMAAHLQKLVPFEVANLCLLSTDARNLFVYSLMGKAEHRETIPFKGSGLEWIGKHHQARVTDLQARERSSPDPRVVPDASLHRMISVPLVIRDQVRGVINLASSHVDAYSQDDVEVLEEISSPLAAAIEREHLLNEVNDERARLAAVVSSTTELIIVVDPAFRVVLANEAAREVFASDQEWEGHQLSEIIQDQLLLELFGKAGPDQVTSGELSLLDGRTLRASLRPIPGSGGQTVGWVAAMRDITYQKELDRMQTEFVDTVSHDLRSPISAIGIAANLVSQMGEVNARQREMLGTITERVAEATELVDDLLDLARIEAGVEIVTEPCAIAPIITRVMSHFEEQIQDKKLRVDVNTDANLPPVMGEAWRLRQVLSNLIGNAIQYTPQGGQITVDARCGDDEIVVSVTDTGVGISPSEQLLVFEKFYRGARPGMEMPKGTGLGLAITRMIVERFGGRIWVESEPNVGSTFSFALAVVEDTFE